jgi:tetratricopeptide (TPR) repeat protein
MAEKGLALSRSIDHAWGIGFAMWHFALAEMLRGRPAEGQRLFLESASHFDRGGCVVMQALARTWAGQCAVDRFAFDEARTLLNEALAEHRRLGNVHDAGTTLRALAKLDLNAGDLAAALRASEESATILRALHDPNCGARSTLVQSEVLHAMGNQPLALRHAEDSAAVQAQLGFHHNRAGALWLTGRSYEAGGDRAAATRGYFEGLREVVQALQDTFLPGLLEAIAGTHPEASVAPRLLGAAAAMREACGAAVFPSERADVDRWRASVRAAHEATFEREYESGRAMTRDDAAAAALALERRTT